MAIGEGAGAVSHVLFCTIPMAEKSKKAAIQYFVTFIFEIVFVSSLKDQWLIAANRRSVN
jgi:hypothetical protein